jgi:hypothetical protein
MVPETTNIMNTEEGTITSQSHNKYPVHFIREPEHIVPASHVSPDLQIDASKLQFDGLDVLTDRLNAASLHTSLPQQILSHFDYQPFSLPPTRVSFALLS